MLPDSFAPHLRDLLRRALPDGSFAVIEGASARTDATAWAAIALHAAGHSPELVVTARASLVRAQESDGGVPVIQERPEARWPTSLALLAWSPDPSFTKNAKSATEHLLSHSGQHWERKPSDVIEHDPLIKGWPWIYGTHSWVEPTSIAILALRAAGEANHARVKEATRMIMNRQLATGWNYGNTKVLGNALLPTPESTGHALTALSGLVEATEVSASLAWLRLPENAAKTPLTLTWRLFGLTAWEQPPQDMYGLVLESLALQRRYGPYDTPLLAQLLAVAAANGSFAALTKGI